MTISISTQGAHELQDLAKRLRSTGNGAMQKRLRQRIRTAATPVVGTVRAAYRAIPAKAPHGTLRRDMAAATRLQNRARSGVRIVVRSARLGAKAPLPRLFEKRVFKHRVFGGDELVTQRGHPTFAPAMVRAAPALRAAINGEVDAIARELES